MQTMFEAHPAAAGLILFVGSPLLSTFAGFVAGLIAASVLRQVRGVAPDAVRAFGFIIGTLTFFFAMVALGARGFEILQAAEWFA